MPSPRPLRKRLSMRILLAEDDANFATLLSNELGSGETNVEWANNGVEAILRLLRQRYDVVLMDLHMPRLDGLSALRIIRALHPETAVIAYSGVAGPEELEESLRIGAKACLSKPFQIEQLKTLLKDIRT